MYGIGIIGLGIMGRRLAQAMRDHSSLHVVTGFDPHPQGELLGFPLKATTLEVISDPQVDCVYIASPPASHAGLVAEVIAAGKAVFCEKPLTANVAEARACADQVRASGIKAAVNFPFSTAPSAVRLHGMVQRGQLGQIESAKLTLRFARWPREWQAEASAWLSDAEQGGFTREAASHFLFLANRMFGTGSLGETRVERSVSGTETVVHALIHYPNLTLEIDAAVAGEADDYNRFELIGNCGMAALTDWYRLEALGQLSERPAPIPSQLDGLVGLLAGEENHGLASFGEAAIVVELIEGILR